jgi:maltooligosyltrehalose synthase
MEKLYAERDIEELEPYYTRHISAMTTEQLNSKRRIAAEFAHRDKRIEELEARIRALQEMLEQAHGVVLAWHKTANKILEKLYLIPSKENPECSPDGTQQ